MWDTDCFGFGVARIIRTAPDGAELSETLSILRDKGYRMVYWYVPAMLHETSRIATAYGGYLADKKFTFAKKLVGLSNQPGISAYNTVPYPSLEADSALIKLALKSGSYSRFRLDPTFPREMYEKLYTCWIARAVSKEIAWEVLVVKDYDDYLGVITLGSKDNQGSIGMAAVAQHARGKGIGKVLLADADILLAERGYSFVQVVTQKRNFGACRLYESCGYQIDKIENVFHFWL
ncbi:MAG: GNAT family N-acetyltransferase [Deltaproteobacteria bacterium]